MNRQISIFILGILISVNTMAIPLLGTWNSKCLRDGDLYHLISFEVHEDLWTKTHWWSTDARCEQIVLEQQTMYQVETKNENWDAQALMAYIRPYTKALAAEFNANGLCDHADWKHGRIIEVTNLKCQGFQIPKFEELLFSIIKIEGPRNNILLLGTSDTEHDGATARTRHQTFGAEVFILDPFSW